MHLDSKDSIRTIEPRISKFYTDYFAETYPRSKNDINFVCSVPYVNSFYFQPQDYGEKSSTGFFGISAGIEYFYHPNRYISLRTIATTDFLVPVPAAVDYFGPHEKMSSTYLSLTDNLKIKRFSLGYGLNYSINNWTFIDDSYHPNQIDSSSYDHIEIKRKSQNFGLTTDVYFQFGRFFFVGLIYRPTLYRIQPKAEFKYEHLISLDFAFKFALRKK